MKRTALILALLVLASGCSEARAVQTVATASVPVQSVTEADEPVRTETDSGLTITPSGNVYTPDVPLSYGWQCAVQDACRRFDVPYSLALAVAETESQFDFDAWSGYAYGLMQIAPVNYDRLRKLGMDPETKLGNIEAGVYMLSELLNRYGDEHLALMAYNCGESGADELWNAGHTSSDYSVLVMRRAEKWAQIVE